MAEKGGRFIGKLTDDHPYADPFLPPLEALHPKLFKGQSPEEYMKGRPDGEEGFFLPGSELLWIQRSKDSKEGIPMSALDPEEDDGRQRS